MVPFLRLYFLIYKAEIRIPAYLTEGGYPIETCAQKGFEKDKESHKEVEHCYRDCSLGELSDPRRTREKLSFRIWSGVGIWGPAKRPLPPCPSPQQNHHSFVYTCTLESTALSLQRGGLQRSLRGHLDPPQAPCLGPLIVTELCVWVCMHVCVCVSVCTCVCTCVSSKAFQWRRFHLCDLGMGTTIICRW